MKELFNYRTPGREISNADILLVMAGDHFLGSCSLEKNNKDLIELKTVTWEDASSIHPESWKNLFSHHTYAKVEVVYCTPIVQLTSPALASVTEKLIEPVFGHSTSVLHEKIQAWNKVVVFSPDALLHDWLVGSFPAAKFHHEFSVIANRETSVPPGGLVLVDFRKDDLSIIVFYDGNMQQSIIKEYASAEDVLYHMLNACNDWSLSQDQVQVRCSGWIDDKSALWKLLRQYFINLELDNPQGPVRCEEYPPHYFSLFNALLLCES